jgi:hypothetical protein
MTIGLGLFFLIHVLEVVRSGWGNFRSMVTGYVIERRSPTNSVAGVPPSGTDATEIVGNHPREV